MSQPEVLGRGEEAFGHCVVQGVSNCSYRPEEPGWTQTLTERPGSVWVRWSMWWRNGGGSRDRVCGVGLGVTPQRNGDGFTAAAIRGEVQSPVKSSWPMIGFELWQTSSIRLRQHAGTWLDHAIQSALATTDHKMRSGGIGFARLSDDAEHEVPYSPDEWDRQKEDYEQGLLAELVMELRGLDWELEVAAKLHTVAPTGRAVTHLAVFINRRHVSSDQDPFFDRVELLQEGARLGATGGRMGPSSQGGLTWWESETGRHPIHYWPLADRRLRGPDFAALLGPAHIRLLGGLDRIREECPCELIQPVDSTNIVLLQLVDTIVINSKLERKAVDLEEYLSPLLDW